MCTIYFCIGEKIIRSFCIEQNIEIILLPIIKSICRKINVAPNFFQTIIFVAYLFSFKMYDEVTLCLEILVFNYLGNNCSEKTYTTAIQITLILLYYLCYFAVSFFLIFSFFLCMLRPV